MFTYRWCVCPYGKCSVAVEGVRLDLCANVPAVEHIVMIISHPMHGCASETSLFSTGFTGIGGANWSHLRLCRIFSDIPEFYKLTAGSHCPKRSTCRGWRADQQGRGEQRSWKFSVLLTRTQHLTLTPMPSYVRNFTRMFSPINKRYFIV